MKTGFAIYGFEEMKKDIKKRKADDGSGNWRTEMDWINDLRVIFTGTGKTISSKIRPIL